MLEGSAIRLWCAAVQRCVVADMHRLCAPWVIVMLLGGCHDLDRFQAPLDTTVPSQDVLRDLPHPMEATVDLDLGPTLPDAPPTGCSDGTPDGQCSLTRPQYCDAGVLVSRCTGADSVVGTADDCGCPGAGICKSNGTCCTPDCSGKSCGSDGCGGSCGSCSGFPCSGNTPICADGTCAACQCPNNCYNVTGYCGAQGGVLKDCYFMTPTLTNTNYCVCIVHCTSGSPPDLGIGDSANPFTGGC